MARVVLVDDHTLFRSGVRAELERQHDIVGEFGDAGDAIARIVRSQTHVILLAGGYTYKEAARELVWGDKTSEAQVSAVLRKLHLPNRHELTRWATDRRIL